MIVKRSVFQAEPCEKSDIKAFDVMVCAGTNNIVLNTKANCESRDVRFTSCAPLLSSFFRSDDH